MVIFTVDLCGFIIGDIGDWSKITGLPRSYHIGRRSDSLVTAWVGEGLEGFFSTVLYLSFLSKFTLKV